MISSTTNPAVKRARRLQKRGWRERTGRYLVEGHRALAPAVAAGTVEELFHATRASSLRAGLLEMARRNGIVLREVSDGVMASLTSVATAPDVLGVVPMAPTALRSLPGGASGLVLSSQHDPAGVGSLMCTAAAIGLDAVIAAEATVDLFEPKVARAAAGAHSLLRVIPEATTPEAVEALRAGGARVVALTEKGSPPWEHDLSGPIALIVDGADGPEGIGGVDARVGVPGGAVGAPIVVRAAVVLYEWVRQRGVA